LRQSKSKYQIELVNIYI